MIKLAKSIKNSALNLRNYPRLLSLYLAAEPEPKGIDNPFFQSIGKELFKTAPDTPAGTNTVGGLIVLVVNVLLLIAGSIAVIFLIIGGYRYIVAHGKEEAMESAKKTMSGAIIGLIIIVLSFAIVTIITRILLQAPIPGTGIE